MDVKKFVEIIDLDFYTGVPDSQLRALCDYLMEKYGTNPKYHIVAANEGNSVGIAAGYHLATGKIPVVYMQNSGEGNVINPVASLLNKKVYAIPVVFVIGWRGEPGIHDEPQHIYQGEVTLKLLENMGISYFLISKETTESELEKTMEDFRKRLNQGENVAFVIRKGALTYEKKLTYRNNYKMTREEIIEQIVDIAGEEPIISTTGKASRELFEIREANGQGHKYDFLTVGSMGHSSSIALGAALQKSDTRFWCIDGDGAALMHMGSLAVIGNIKPDNLIHIVINNEAHETVGGMQTAASGIDLMKIADGCGYENIYCVHNMEELKAGLSEAKRKKGLTFMEVKCSIGAREDLGRPTTTAIENKENFMKYLKELS